MLGEKRTSALISSKGSGKGAQGNAGIAKKLKIDTSDPNTAAFLELLVLKVLDLDFQARVCRACLLEVFLTKTDNPWISVMREATVAQHEAAREYKDKALCKKELGAPHVHAWNAVIQVVQDELEKDKTTHAENLKLIQEYENTYAGKEVQEVLVIIARDVRFFRVAKAFGKDQKKIEANVQPGTPSFMLWTKLLRPCLLSTTGTQELAGVAPPGDVSRQLQEFLDTLREAK